MEKQIKCQLRRVILLCHQYPCMVQLNLQVKLVSGYCHMFNIQCVVARLANIIGPTNTHGVIYDFITSYHPTQIILIFWEMVNKINRISI